MAFTTFTAAPCFSQSAPEKSNKNSGAMATIDRAAIQNRTNCEREAKAQKLKYWKRRVFIKNCMNR